MTKPPENPRLYHITHVENLSAILEEGGLWSEAEMARRRAGHYRVGISNLKQRRLERCEVNCHPGTKVGDYVPFYLCPRSVMLYVLHRGNHPELSYSGGQSEMIHLEADLRAVVAWAESEGAPWAFSDRNAGATYAEFFRDLDDLDQVNWGAVAATDWHEAQTKDGKQAEFLVHGFFPWTLVEKIGVVNRRMEQRVQQLLEGVRHRPEVAAEPSWYY